MQLFVHEPIHALFSNCLIIVNTVVCHFVGDANELSIYVWLQRPLGIWENILRGNERGRELWFGRLIREWPGPGQNRIAVATDCWVNSSWATVHALDHAALSTHPLRGTIKCPNLNGKPLIWISSFKLRVVFYLLLFQLLLHRHLLCRFARSPHMYTPSRAVYVTEALLIFLPSAKPLHKVATTTNQDFIERWQISNWLSIGKGTFGVVLQAKAEDIVKSAPHRNIVAVKTTRGMCLCAYGVIKSI